MSRSSRPRWSFTQNRWVKGPRGELGAANRQESKNEKADKTLSSFDNYTAYLSGVRSVDGEIYLQMKG